MTLTKERKIYLALACIAGLGLITDQLFFGASSGPQPASAATSVLNAVVPTSIDTMTPELPLDISESLDKPTLARTLDRVAENRKPTANEIRDPFQPPSSWQSKPASEEQSQFASHDANSFREQHQLLAVVPNRRQPCAMVNGKLLFLGQSLDGFKLITVANRRAMFESDGKTVELFMDQEAKTEE